MTSSKIFLLSLLFISGCSVSGHYRSEGPCKGFHKDQDACERAVYNSTVIGKVEIGQSIDEVRKIMGRRPEQREATKTSEQWEYLTNYMSHRYTTIIFKNGVVTEIK